MDFFAKNYNYIIFLSFWSYLCIALVCLVGQKAKINKISYYWIIAFAVFGAIVKFIETFSYGNSISNKILYIVNYLCIYACYISLFIGAVQSYLNFVKDKFLKYLIFPLIVIPLFGYCFFGIVVFKILAFICFFITVWIFILLIQYHYYRIVSSEKRRFTFIICASILFGLATCILELCELIDIDSVALFALLELISACSLLAVSNLIFKHLKIIREKKAKIYDYIPLYWKHVPLASIFALIFILGLFFSNYSETNSKKTIIRKTDFICADIATTSSVIFKTIDQISKNISNSPFLKETLLNNFNKSQVANMAKMLNSYKNSFDLSLVCVLDMKGRIVVYSNYPDMDFSKKNELHSENIKFFKHLQKLINNNELIKETSYINNSFFYSTIIINSSRYANKLGIVVIKDPIPGVIRKLSKFKDAFIIDGHGRILVSGKKDQKIKKLWSSDGQSNEEKALLLSEIKDKDIISLNREQFYVSRVFLSRENWSVVKLTSLSNINQSKTLIYLITSALIIIVLLISYSISQSNKILALALLHQDILNSAKSIIIISTDLQGKIAVCGKGTSTLTGYNIEELVRTDFSKVIFFKKNKEPITSFNEAINYQEENGGEWLCRKKDGTYINILMYISPQFSVSGKVIGYIFSGLDITSTKNAEKALEEQFKFLQSLLDNIPVPVYYKDDQMSLIGCNRAFEKMIAHSKSEIVGTPTQYLFSDQKAILFSMKTDLQIAKDMKPISYELPVNFSGNKLRNIIFYKATFKNADGKFGGIIEVLLDVTKERKIQQERDALQSSLIQKNKLASLGELAGSIAHELNNPLSIIMGFSQVLSRNKNLGTETEKGLKNIYDAALRSQNIIKNMLEFSRTSSVNISDIDLNKVVESTLLILEKDFAKAGIEIIKDLMNFSIYIKSNAMQMQQVILNIFINAKDVMPNGGKITIKTEEQDFNYVLSISDTGPGIAPEIISKIFDPFFTTKEVDKGTGLGLSICYGIIKNLKGEISVESTVGKGTIFYIKFPIAR